MTDLRVADLDGRSLVDAAQGDPAGFRRQASRLLADDDPDRQLYVRWGLGLALRELGELEDAQRELETAAGMAERGAHRRTAALIRSSLAAVLLRRGESARALEETEAAAPALDGPDAARNQMQRGFVLQRLGRHDEAIDAYDQACPVLRATQDVAAEARLLSNRGILHTYRGDHAAARADLERALVLSRADGSERGVAMALWNLGFLAGREGQIPEALQRLSEADERFRRLASGATDLAVLDADRAEVLADAGLVDEAVERAEAAVRALTRTGDRTNLGEAELLLARTLLLARRFEDAGTAAAAAGRRFVEDRRPGWALQARFVALAAAARRGEDVDVAAAERLARDLAGGGWTTEARIARLTVAQQALATGDTATASRALTDLQHVSRRAPALARAHAWYATALLRTATGDRAGARRATSTGLALLDRSRLVFGSAELRAHAAAHTTDLVRLAVRSALEDARPAAALVALDRVRAAEGSVRPRPPDDPVLAADLAELRRLDEAGRDAARSGEADLRPIMAARARLERRIRDRDRTIGGDGSARGSRLDVAALRRTLAGRTLAAYLHLDGDLHLLTVEPGATRHRALGSLDEVRTTIAHLRSALRRLAYGHGSPAALAAADASIARAVDDLQVRLGLDRLDLDGLVVVPSGALDGMPWGVLATVTGRMPTVAPSALAWSTAATSPGQGGPIVLAAGPDLPGAETEIRTLQRRYPAATCLQGPAATGAAVREALEGAGTAHLAAHGSFRADNPMFSSLRFADGPLTVYELETLTHPPDRLVLSSCEAAAARTLQGDAVLGLSSVLLRLGVTTLVAPVIEVPDRTTGPLMVELHAGLAAGHAPIDALGAAIAAAPGASPQERAVRASFVVMGAGTT